MKRNAMLALLACLCCIYMAAGCASGPHLTSEHIQVLNPRDGFPPSYIDPLTGIEFILVPQGTFIMGSSPGEKGRDTDEGPAHFVSLDSFYIAKYEVTQAQWQQIMKDNPSRFKGHPQLPVETVSWNNVQKFIKRLNKKTGIAYRLPTEAEWEYACRAGTQTPFFPGSDNKTLIEYAWFDQNSGGESHPVGTRLPNTWGLYDMQGNISEWVGDGRRGYLSRAEHNPRGIDSSSKALHRGGSWLYPARLCRAANRMSVEKDFRTHIIGFRLALDKNALAQKD